LERKQQTSATVISVVAYFKSASLAFAKDILLTQDVEQFR